MIIKEVIGENVLKYSTLELSGLPETGLISVSGKNESGKTSIGEMVCFGLFGRTFSLNDHELDKLIKWGRDSCSVAIGFTAKDNKTYRVVRHLNREKVHGAQLFVDGDSEPMTTGGTEVSRALSELIGFQYEEYVESFYLAQRELRTPSSDGNTIKVMAGISSLAGVSEELEEALDCEQKIAAEIKSEIGRLEKDREELNYDEQRLPLIEDMGKQCKSLATAQQSFLEQCTQAVSTYYLTYSKVKTLKAVKAAALVFSILAFVLSLEFMVAWWWVGHPHKLGAVGDSLQKINEVVAGGEENFLFFSALFFIGSLICSGLFAFLVFKERRFKDQTEEVTMLFERLGSDDRHQFQAVIDQSSILIDSGSDTAINQSEAGESRQQEDEAENDDNNCVADSLKDGRDLSGRMGSFLLEPQELRDETDKDLRELDSLCKRGFAQVALLKKECEQERQLGELAGKHTREIADEERKLNEQSCQIQVYEQGIELLRNGIAHMSRRFNTDVLEYTTRAIPLFTDGHYEHLKIDESMNIRVFSCEKHDFMDFDELSSGTQRQIMLALRLAMSQKLMHTAATSNQFIFLDEPFAFFDKDRIHSTLHSLPDISKEISQIWIVAQEIDQDAGIDVDIRCHAENDELILDCANNLNTII